MIAVCASFPLPKVKRSIMGKRFLVLGPLILSAAVSFGQDRDTKVRNDRKSFLSSKDWIYNDLDQGRRMARETSKPLFVVFRCIPCEACQEFDDDVARRDVVIRDLMDRYVCVRIVQANSMDLAHFQFDFDLSFAAFLMHPDLTIYGRFGTRSRREEAADLSLEGLSRALAAGLKMHTAYETIKPSLSGKQVKPGRYATPRDDPILADRYQAKLDYTTNTASGCMHCHQIRDAERRAVRASVVLIPDEVLYPYPDPEVLGLSMDPKQMATVRQVVPGSSAADAGIHPGDTIVTLSGQPLLSIADLQWVLHKAPATADLPAEVRHDGTTRNVVLTLREGWRHGDISWRATTWELRRMGFGGMRLDDLTDEQRVERKLPKNVMALQVRHVGEFGEHAIAKKAGFRKGDVLIALDDREDRMSESEVLAYFLQRKRPGDGVVVNIIRGEERKTLTYSLP
jgi:serine protease Do